MWMEQAQIAEEAGAVAVMALECQLRFRQKGVARMSDIGLIKEIKKAITIPVMAKARTGEFTLIFCRDLIPATLPLHKRKSAPFALCTAWWNDSYFSAGLEFFVSSLQVLYSFHLMHVHRSFCSQSNIRKQVFFYMNNKSSKST
jgi:hypothetical protein